MTKIVLAMHTWAKEYVRYVSPNDYLKIFTAKNGEEVLSLIDRTELIVIEAVLPPPPGYNRKDYIGGGEALYTELRRVGYSGLIIFFGDEELIRPDVLVAIKNDRLCRRIDTQQRDRNALGGVILRMLRERNKST